jgi:purine-nucleoside phosphorylase
MDNTLHDRLRLAATALADTTGHDGHDIAVVLGSGLGDYAKRHAGSGAGVPFDDLPGFPIPGAAGHTGTVYTVSAGDNRVLLFAGRAHVYEGYSVDDVSFAVRTAVFSGCHTVVLTNAAGGMGDGLEPGDLVAITDHLNLSGLSPLRGTNDVRLGPRHPDMTDVYTPALRQLATEVAVSVGVVLKEGVYAWWQGPMFETPAEIRMMQRLGADLVGMSTVPEATAARHMGARVLALSLCTNLAAGISPDRLSAEEVIAEGARAAGRFGRFLDALLPRLTAPPS